MKLFASRILPVVAICMLLVLQAHADVPMLLNYQGNLTAPDGTPKNGTFTMDFSVYDAETVGNQLPAGSPWAETQSVQVVGGVFNVLLGSVTDIPADLFDGGPSDDKGPLRFLEVAVGGETLSPRRRIVSAAYAVQPGLAHGLPSDAIIIWEGQECPPGFGPLNYIGETMIRCKNNGGVAPDAKRVFVTSSDSVGQLNHDVQGEWTAHGIAAADLICQDLADAAGLNGSFLAWIADVASSPASRFVRHAGAYELVDGTRIADDWHDLVDGTLLAPIDRDESGVVLNPDTVWTGTTSTGDPRRNPSSVDNHCVNWSSTSLARYASSGWMGLTDHSWAHGPSIACDSAHRHYCFEQ